MILVVLACLSGILIVEGNDYSCGSHENYEFYPVSEYSCSQHYYECVYGTEVRLTCPARLVYDPELLLCNYPISVDTCSSVVITGCYDMDGNTIDGLAYTYADNCAEGYYYECENGVSVEYQCSNGRMYDTGMQICQYQSANFPECESSSIGGSPPVQGTSPVVPQTTRSRTTTVAINPVVTTENVEIQETTMEEEIATTPPETEQTTTTTVATTPTTTVTTTTPTTTVTTTSPTTTVTTTTPTTTVTTTTPTTTVTSPAPPSTAAVTTEDMVQTTTPKEDVTTKPEQTCTPVATSTTTSTTTATPKTSPSNPTQTTPPNPPSTTTTTTTTATTTTTTATTTTEEPTNTFVGFVVDDTGSMSVEITAVKIWIEECVTGVNKDCGATPTGGWLVVSYNDPYAGDVVGPTLDASEIINEISGYYAHGGGDCPEMAMAGLEKLAKRVPTDNTDCKIYLFTDATAKDYYKAGTITELYKQKGCKFVPILTGCCGTCPPACESVSPEYCHDHVTDRVSSPSRASKSRSSYSSTQETVFFTMSEETGGSIYVTDKPSSPEDMLEFLEEEVTLGFCPSTTVAGPGPGGYKCEADCQAMGMCWDRSVGTCYCNGTCEFSPLPHGYSYCDGSQHVECDPNTPEETVPDMNDCESYFQCSFGDLYHCTCASGTVHSQTSPSNCDRPAYVPEPPCGKGIHTP